MRQTDYIESQEILNPIISKIQRVLVNEKTDNGLDWTSELSEKQLTKELIQISKIQRFLQKWQADPDFRQQVLTDPYQAISRYNINTSSEEISFLCDQFSFQKQSEVVPLPSSLRYYQKLTNYELRRANEIKRIADSSIEPSYKAWRERQMARTVSELNQFPQASSVIHYPVCFELSKGCSVGCWFCGVSAPRLSDIFTYNQENARLWREVLELMKEILGPAAGTGFCYCASDPLDNPDYEKFCSDFHEILGIFPPTTTAQPLKNPERTRALLKLSIEKDCILNRFSILSLKMLDQVHEEFSSEELAFVDFVLQNKEAGIPKSTELTH